MDLAELTQTSEFDDRGTVTHINYPGGQDLYFSYGRIGNLEQVCSESSCDNTVGDVYYTVNSDTDYDVYGHLLKETYGNGVVADYSYFTNSGRLQSKTTSKDTTVYSQRSYT